MRQYVLTRTSYGPVWDLEANQRRLAITRAVTARLMAAQTVRDWTWVVLLDPRDPLIEERRAVYRTAAPAYLELLTVPSSPLPAQDRYVPVRQRQRIAALNYTAPWRDAVGPADDTVLTTRLDDDDGLAPDALARYRAAAKGITTRTALMLPRGVRVWRRRFTAVTHEKNAMHTLLTPPGDCGTVYDYNHTKVAERVGPPVMVDREPGWLWVRHQDTISGWRSAEQPINRTLKALFPVDWAVLWAAWA